MKNSCFCLFLIILQVKLYESQQKISPCPKVFTYDLNNDLADTWFGTLKLTTNVVLHGISIDVIFDRRAPLFGAYYFNDVTTRNNIEYHIENKNYNLDPSETLLVNFYVKYNQRDQHIPLLKQVRLNGQNICVDLPKIVTPTTKRSTVANDQRKDNADTIHSVQPIRPSYHEESTTRRSLQNPDNTGLQSSQNSRDENNYSNDNGFYDPKRSVNNARNVNEQPVTNNNGNSGRGNNQGNTRPLQNNNNINNNNFNIDRESDRREYEASSNVRPPVNREQDNFNKPIGSGSNSLTARPTGTTNYYNDRTTKTTKNYYDENTLRPTINYYQDDYERGQSNGGRNQQEYTTTGKYFSGDLPFLNGGEATTHSILSNDREEDCGVVVPKSNPLIILGEETYNGQFPWHVALYISSPGQLKYICGGSLVKLNLIVTSAHCVTHEKTKRAINTENLLVYAGKYNLRKWTGPEQDGKVDEIIVHPDYDYERFYSDIAILKLKERMTRTNYVRPVCVWKFDSDLKLIVDKLGSVPGFGYNERGLVSEDLSFINMPVVTHEKCIWSNRDFFSKITSDKSFCAGFRNGTSVCNGDSGGGMVFKQGSKFYLRGIVSVSVALQNSLTCDPNHFAVFADVAKFAEWIRNYFF